MSGKKNTSDKRNRVMIASAILVAFLIVFILVISSYIIRFDRELEAENRTRLDEVSSYTISHMTSAVAETQDALQAVASAVSSIESNTTKMEYLNQIATQYNFAYIGCAGTDGMLYSTMPSESVDISGEEYFKSALRGESSISNLTRKIFRDRAASGILLSVPMGKDSPKGALVAMMEISHLSAALSLESFGGEGYSYVIDKNGTIIMRTQSLDFNNLFKAWRTAKFTNGTSYENFLDDLSNKRKGVLYYSYLGVKKVAYYANIPFNDWYLINIVSEEVVSGKADRMTKEMVFIGVAILLGFFGLLLLALRSYGVSQDSQQANSAKSAFLANMSHEIRTPMNAIVGISEILLRDGLTAGQRSKVLTILNSGKGLLTIINDILDLSKIEAGKFTIVEEPYELESMLYDLTMIAAVRIGEKPIEFMVEIDPLLPRSFVGDMGRVKQILINIIGNAIKFTINGSIRLIINGKQDNGQWLLEMEVRDTGIGIRTEDLDKLFASFTQVDTQRNRNIEGTGLGLSISQGLCRMMGGAITVTSEYGRGSSFVVTLRQGIDGVEPGIIVPDPARYRLLVCEPSDILRDYESACIDKLGLRYDICQSEDELIRKAAQGAYTHILVSSQTLRLLPAGEEALSQRIAIYRLNEHAFIDTASSNIFIPMFQLHLPYLLRGTSECIGSPKNIGVVVGELRQMPYVSILIVDDNIVNIQVAKGLMEPYHMQIDYAVSGEESIQRVEAGGYDLVLMDHMMPGMSGIEALHQIRALSKEGCGTLPIIALTANATSDARSMFLQEGFDDFLSKPIEMQKLNEVLRKYLKDLNESRAAAHSEGPPVQHADALSSIWTDIGFENMTYGEVDFGKGLAMVGSLTAYTGILSTYLRSTKEKLPALIEWLETDKNRFVIEIHGLKGANAAIGAVQLSGLAAEMELLGKTDRFDGIGKLLAVFTKRNETAFHEIEEFLTQSTATVPQIRFGQEGDGRKHIVVVDDNPVNLDLAESVLQVDYRLTKLESGEALLDFLKQKKPDMILLDIQMPGLSGYETLEQIRQRKEWKDIPVIFLTGQNDVQSERMGFRLGAKDFIRKPFDHVVMSARIKSQMELYQYQMELREIICEKTTEVEELQHVITITWAEIIESRDGTTGNHVRHTTNYYEALLRVVYETPAYQEGLSKESIPDLLRASALHDIGKIGISDTVLKKPAALSKEEFDYMKTHSQIGADMIQKIIDRSRADRFLLYARDMALYHHERWNGTGYPCGLKGDEIPLYVQILTIADIFDALTAVRPYKRAFTFGETLEIMNKDRDIIYSPELLDVFLAHQETFQKMLDNKEL